MGNKRAIRGVIFVFLVVIVLILFISKFVVSDEIVFDNKPRIYVDISKYENYSILNRIDVLPLPQDYYENIKKDELLPYKLINIPEPPIKEKMREFYVDYEASPTSSPTPSPSASSSVEPYLSPEEKFEPEILEEFNEREFVTVIIELYDNDLGFMNNEEEYKKKLRQRQDEILFSLGEDFIIKHKYNIVPYLSGEVNKEGFDKLREHGFVKFIYLRRILGVDLMESVPLINADDVWNIRDNNGFNVKGRGQVICVIDMGIDYTHPDLGGCRREDFLGGRCIKVIDGNDEFNGDSDPVDDNGHGTHVAGIVAANGNVRGVAPDAQLVAVKVCDSSGDNCPADDMIAGVDWCLDNRRRLGITVLTMSIGDHENHNNTNCPNWMDSAIDRAYSLNLPFTISSGNEGFKNGISYPACSKNSTSVGAVYDANVGARVHCINENCTKSCIDDTTNADKVTCYSNTGNNLDLLAPGSVIRSTVLNGGYDNYDGTSMAAPHVAGVIALMKQVDNNLGVDKIVDILKNSGVSVKDAGNNLTFSRVNALQAVTSVKCVVPTSGMVIRQSTIFCRGTYYLLPVSVITSELTAINVIRSGDNVIVLDCNGATLIGDRGSIGTGISAHGRNIIIKNCNIQNYVEGIQINGSNNSVRNNNLTNAAIYLGGSNNSAEYNDIFNGYIIAGRSIYEDRAFNVEISHNNLTYIEIIWPSGIVINEVSNVKIEFNKLRNLPLGISHVNAYNSNFTIRYNKIENVKSGIHTPKYSKVEFNILNNVGIGIKPYKSMVISNIIENANYGIYLRDYRSYNIIKYNLINNSLEGIKIESSNDSIMYNNISNSGSGIVIRGISGLGDFNNITSNIIRDNDVGIKIEAGSEGNKIMNNVIAKNKKFGILLKNVGKDNEIKYNDLVDNQDYEIVNNGTGDVDATQNWWGTANSELISQKIYDFYDESNLGIVRFIPFLGMPVAYGGQVEFIRGDANIDGEVDIGDPIKILLYLFSRTQASCLDAGDANDDGKLNIVDAQYLLNFLFWGGRAPAEPYPNAGVDDSEDDLSCEGASDRQGAGGAESGVGNEIINADVQKIIEKIKKDKKIDGKVKREIIKLLGKYKV